MLLQLDFFNNLLNNIKENNVVQNFINEISDYLEGLNNKLPKQKDNSLKQDGNLYQVVDRGINGAYLQNVSNNKITYKTDIPKEILNEIGNDTVLRYNNNKYIIEDELTQKFFDNLVGIKEYEEIQNRFLKESNIEKNEPNTKYKIENKSEKGCILSYGIGDNHMIEVPNELIPFWAECGEFLCYENGEFNRLF